MEKTKKVVFNLMSFIFFFGLIFGPIGWIYSATFQSTLHDFEANGTKTTAVVNKRHKSRHGRATVIKVNIRYINKSSNELIYLEDIEVNSFLYNKLSPGMEVDIIYKNGEAILVDNYKFEK